MVYLSLSIALFDCGVVIGRSAEITYFWCEFARSPRLLGIVCHACYNPNWIIWLLVFESRVGQYWCRFWWVAGCYAVLTSQCGLGFSASKCSEWGDYHNGENQDPTSPCEQNLAFERFTSVLPWDWEHWESIIAMLISWYAHEGINTLPQFCLWVTI